jgi:hypothetical protein
MAGPHGRLVELINKPEMSAHTNDRDNHDVIRLFTAKICNEYRNMEDWQVKALWYSTRLIVPRVHPLSISALVYLTYNVPKIPAVKIALATYSMMLAFVTYDSDYAGFRG